MFVIESFVSAGRGCHLNCQLILEIKLVGSNRKLLERRGAERTQEGLSCESPEW